MRIGRVLPPAAAIVRLRDLVGGVRGIVSPAKSIGIRERELLDFFNVSHVSLVSSGTAALVLALRAVKAGTTRTDVVVPAYTCFSVPGAIVKAGLRPVPCDIDPATFDFDRRQLERLVSEKTLCVISHHLFGIPSNVDATRTLCRRFGVPVVEDAAQAMGGYSSDGRLLGTLGDIGVFSVGRGKNITCGSGGIVVTSSDSLGARVAEQARRLPALSPGSLLKELAKVTAMAALINPRTYWLPAAVPGLGLGTTVFPTHVALHRLSGMQAGILQHWRERLVESNASRSAIAADLCSRIGHTVLAMPSTYLRLPVLAESQAERDRLLDESERRGLGFSRAYPSPINEIPQLRRCLDGGRYPAARSVADRIFTVPTHPFVTEHDRRAIADCLRSAVLPVRPAA